MWLWWISAPERLSTSARNALDDAESVGVPAVCCWEVVTLSRLGRITLDRPVQTWVSQALAGGRVRELPITASMAVRAGALPEPFPGDPADRLIYATARDVNAPLITRDQRIREFDPVRTRW